MQLVCVCVSFLTQHAYTTSYDNVLCMYCILAREDNANTPVKFTYTPLHGVGQEFATAAFSAFDFPPFLSIPEQVRTANFIHFLVSSSMFTN